MALATSQPPNLPEPRRSLADQGRRRRISKQPAAEGGAAGCFSFAVEPDARRGHELIGPGNPDRVLKTDGFEGIPRPFWREVAAPRRQSRRDRSPSRGRPALDRRGDRRPARGRLFDRQADEMVLAALRQRVRRRALATTPG